MGSMLANRLSLKSRFFAVPKIKTEGGTLSQNPQRIVGAFHNFDKKSIVQGQIQPSPSLIGSLITYQSPNWKAATA